LKKVVKRFMVFVLVITLATCNTGTGFLLVKAEEKLETKEKTELGSNVNNEGYCKPEVVEEIVSDRTTDSTTFLLSNGMKQTNNNSANPKDAPHRHPNPTKKKRDTQRCDDKTR